MELYYLLFLFVFNYFAVEALLRVEREATCPQITNFSGRVKYRRRGTRAVFRCPKKFDRYGPKFATCQDDGTWSNEPPLCTKTGCLPLDQNLESNLITDVVNQAVVKFSCDQNYHLLGETLAYCDGKDWSAPLPRCAAPHELTECDFEEDLCGWAQDDSDEQDWIRTLGPTPTGNTGPKYDHTYGDTGNGHYLFFETSNPTLTGHQAILYSPIYNEHLSPMCFDFWYHILGPDEAGHVGSLEVFVLDQSQFIDDDNIQPLFVKEGNQGDKWQRGDIFIDSQVESYQITIVATRALSYISDIAIDDVRLYNCSRKNEIGRATTMEQTSTTPTHPITKSTTTMTQTGRGIKSTKAISTTNIAETGTPLLTTMTSKKIKPSFKPITTIKNAAQSMSVSQISDLTRALSSITTTAMTQTTIIPRPSKTESTNTTTQTSSTPKLPTTESTTFSTQTTATPRFSTARSLTTASQTSATPNRSETESTTERTQTSTTPRPFTTESTTFTKQTSATPRFSTAKSITTASQTSTTPKRSETESTTETTQTSTTPRPVTTESTTITTQTSATPKFSTGKSITIASQTSTTPNRSETEYATETTQTSTTPRPFKTESTTFTKQTSATPRFSTAKSITTASQTSTTPNRYETESTTETTQTSTTPRPVTTESTTITKQPSATPRFSTAKSITTASQTSTTPNRSKTESATETTQTSTTSRPFMTESTTFTKQTSATPKFSTAKSITIASQTSTTPNRFRTSTTQASTPLKLLTTMYMTTATQTSSTPRPSSTTSVKASSKDKTLSKMRASTSKIDLPTKTSSTSSTMLTSVCCISSITSPSSTLITKDDLSTTHQTSTGHMDDITGKEKVISDSQNVNTEKTQTSISGTTHVSKPTKRTDALSTRQSVIRKTTRGNSISLLNKRSHDIENEILISLVIGLCVGMVAGSIIICMIACVCVRRRKFYTSSYESELKPMKTSDSVQSLNNGLCEENENRTSANLENQYPMPQDAGSSLTALT